MNFNMARQSRVIGKNRVISDLAIMRNMAIGHEQVIVTQARYATSGCGSTVNTAIFTDDVSAADFQT